jgi:hypothetical protein
MTTTASVDTNHYMTASHTVSHPVPVASGNSAPGTVGHTGTVEYSKATAATVRETYVVTAKK